MVAAGYINQNTANQAAANGLGNQLVDAYTGKSADYRYPSYFDAVINEAVHDYGLTEADIVNNGYRIYTELGIKSTKLACKLSMIVKIYFHKADGTRAQSGSVALDPKTRWCPCSCRPNQ